MSLSVFSWIHMGSIRVPYGNIGPIWASYWPVRRDVGGNSLILKTEKPTLRKFVQIRRKKTIPNNYQMQEKTLAYRFQKIEEQICHKETSDRLYFLPTRTMHHHLYGTRKWPSRLLGLYVVTWDRFLFLNTSNGSGSDLSVTWLFHTTLTLAQLIT